MVYKGMVRHAKGVLSLVERYDMVTPERKRRGLPSFPPIATPQRRIASHRIPPHRIADLPCPPPPGMGWDGGG